MRAQVLLPVQPDRQVGRSATSFNLIHGENDWKFLTSQGEEINKFMGIYVRMLVERRARERKAAAQAARQGGQ